MERKLVNIMEYLALGELESHLSANYPHQQLFYEPLERETLLQDILNHVPPVYMWIAESECPSLEQLSQEENQQLHQALSIALKNRLQQCYPHPCPYSATMTEVFY